VVALDVISAALVSLLALSVAAAAAVVVV